MPAGRAVLGDPATKLETQMEIRKALRRLPRLAASVAELQKALSGQRDGYMPVLAAPRCRVS